MEIYILVDRPEFEENEAQVVDTITAWVDANSAHATLVYVPQTDNAELQLGIEMKIKAPKQLIPPLNDFYKIAKQFKCDFVVGAINDGEREDVCFFGNEEGKADAFEVACYLGFD